MTHKVEPKLSQDKMFIKEIIPYDFTEYMGQYALEIKYTNGKTDMFTTKSIHSNMFGSHDFETLEELKTFQKSIS